MSFLNEIYSSKCNQYLINIKKMNKTIIWSLHVLNLKAQMHFTGPLWSATLCMQSTVCGPWLWLQHCQFAADLAQEDVPVQVVWRATQLSDTQIPSIFWTWYLVSCCLWCHHDPPFTSLSLALSFSGPRLSPFKHPGGSLTELRTYCVSNRTSFIAILK